MKIFLIFKKIFRILFQFSKVSLKKHIQASQQKRFVKQFLLPLQNFGYHKIILLGQQNIVLLTQNYLVEYHFVGLNKVLLSQQNCLVRLIRYAITHACSLIVSRRRDCMYSSNFQKIKCLEFKWNLKQSSKIILFQKSKSILLGQQDYFARLTNEFCSTNK